MLLPCEMAVDFEFHVIQILNVRSHSPGKKKKKDAGLFQQKWVRVWMESLC